MDLQVPAGRYLAYEHSIQIDTDESKVATVHEVALATCRSAVADLCAVLDSRISTGRDASATIRFRAKASGIQKIVAALSKQAEVTEQSTTAEDLAGPIEDAARKLAMLSDYRTELESLRKRAAGDVDSLIKVNKELAQTQSDIEALSGEHAHLTQRVETEILNVSIGAWRNRSFWRPITTAAADFGTNFSAGVSAAMTGVAYIIPWAAMAVLAVWLTRKLWRRRRQSAQGA
jgi:flagellar biosynthesis chaperone FliJ